MRKKRNIYIIQYDKLSAFINGLNETEIANLESGKFEIKFDLLNRKELRNTSEKKVQNFDEYTSQSIIDKLNLIKTREGIQIFNV